MRRFWGAILAAALLAGMLGLPLGVAAHTGTPVRVERVKAGPYTLELRHYSEARAGQSLGLMIVPVGEARPAAIEVAADPGSGVDALPARVRTAPDPDDPAATDALIPLAVAGTWVVRIAAAGPAGRGQAETAVIAAAPGAIPVPVGWALGLSPLIGIVAFAVAQRRWLRRMRDGGWGMRNEAGVVG